MSDPLSPDANLVHRHETLFSNHSLKVNYNSNIGEEFLRRLSKKVVVWKVNVQGNAVFTIMVCEVQSSGVHIYTPEATSSYGRYTYIPEVTGSYSTHKVSACGTDDLCMVLGRRYFDDYLSRLFYGKASSARLLGGAQKQQEIHAQTCEEGAQGNFKWFGGRSLCMSGPSCSQPGLGQLVWRSCCNTFLRP